MPEIQPRPDQAFRQWAPTFATAEAYTQECNALARADYTLYGVRLLRQQAVNEFLELDEAAAVSASPIAQGRIARFGDVLEQELEDFIRRYLRRGSGIAEENVTQNTTRQMRQY